MRTRTATVRMAAIVAAGSLAVHQLRFLLWYGHGSDHALSAQGHAYLTVVGPAVVAAGVLGFARHLDRLARGARTSAPRFGSLWVVLVASLVAMYAVQECLEGFLSHGHPDGVAGVLGYGGWLALPVSAVVGLALAVLLRATARASELLSPGGAPRPRLRVAPPLLGALVPALPRPEPCLAAASARGPPAASA